MIQELGGNETKGKQIGSASIVVSHEDRDLKDRLEFTKSAENRDLATSRFLLSESVPIWLEIGKGESGPGI